MMEAVILAGGMGKRLHDAVPGLPKPMAPVNGKPFLWHLLSWLIEYPVSKIILSTGYKHESIIEYFGDAFQGVPVEYAIEKEPLGTGGGLMLATERVSGSDFFVINGDTYFPVNLAEMYLFHTAQHPFITVALKKMTDFSRYGAVECIDGKIIQFHEKKFCHDGFINGGIYVMNRKMLISRHFPEIFSLEKDILEKSSGKDDLRGMVFTEPFLDIGIPEEYHRAGDVLRKENKDEDE
jgi:D-glycero-alpha-D-manno-heptose 1-phosphate guanylyltransferase